MIEKFRYIIAGGTQTREVFRVKPESDAEFYRQAEADILATAKKQREEQALFLAKLQSEKQRLSKAKNGLKILSETDQDVEPVTQIVSGTMPVGSGNSLKSAEIDGLSKNALTGLFNARIDKKKK